MHLVSSLNNFPKLRVYTPFSFNFLPGLVLKLLIYLLIIITSFAVTFSLLLSNKEAFTSYATSFGKTFSWMLGDLAYDDGFVGQSKELLYPIQTTIIFMIFTTMSIVFMINIIVVHSSEQMKRFEKTAKFFHVNSRLILQLGIDGTTFGLHYNKHVRKISVSKNKFENKHCEIGGEKPGEESNFEGSLEKENSGIERKLDIVMKDIADLKGKGQVINEMLGTLGSRMNKMQTGNSY